MSKGFLVDTDILIDFLRGWPEAVKYVNSQADNIVVSAISIAELYAGVKDEKDKEELEAFIGIFPVLEINGQIARQAGLYKNKYFKSHNIGLADALIAASANHHNVILKTLNCRHFPMFPAIEPPYVK